MNVEIMRCDEINANHHFYPKEVVKKAIDEFNKRDKNDISRVVFASSSDELNYDDGIPMNKKLTLGKINKLELDNNNVIGSFNFDNSPLGKHMKSLISSTKEISCDFCNNRIIMSSYGELNMIKENNYEIENMSVYGFHFGLDSVWRND